MGKEHRLKRGYAVLDSDEKGTRRVLKAHPTFLEISLVSGTCVRVRSGEPIPKGATAVVTLENTNIIENIKVNDIDYFNIDDMEYEIEVLIASKKNDNIRDAGCGIDCDEHILERFTRLGPADLGILTLCGIDSIEVVKLPSIGLLSIGNELEEPGNIFTLGRIVASNRITLISLLKENDYDLIDFGISAYRLSEMIKKIKKTLDKVNVLVIMGRANDKDLLKPILKECFQAYIYFGCVGMKPGKSTTFAVNTYNGIKDTRDKIFFLDPGSRTFIMRQVTENGTIFICDNCNAVIEGGVAAKKHYENCTIQKTNSETEDLDSLNLPVSDEKELLIAEVFCREPLWNSLIPYAERSHNITSPLWHEIDIVLGVQKGYSQKTFKSLRDRFVRLIAEENKSKRSNHTTGSRL